MVLTGAEKDADSCLWLFRVIWDGNIQSRLKQESQMVECMNLLMVLAKANMLLLIGLGILIKP